MRCACLVRTYKKHQATFVADGMTPSQPPPLAKSSNRGRRKQVINFAPQMFKEYTFEDLF
jgi:hypothetical protein